MEIGVVHWITGRQFSITIAPDIHPLPPPSPQISQLTRTVKGTKCL